MARKSSKDSYFTYLYIINTILYPSVTKGGADAVTTGGPGESTAGRTGRREDYQLGM
jgi:hypothetical protein